MTEVRVNGGSGSSIFAAACIGFLPSSKDIFPPLSGSPTKLRRRQLTKDGNVDIGAQLRPASGGIGRLPMKTARDRWYEDE